MSSPQEVSPGKRALRFTVEKRQRCEQYSSWDVHNGSQESRAKPPLICTCNSRTQKHKINHTRVFNTRWPCRSTWCAVSSYSRVPKGLNGSGGGLQTHHYLCRSQSKPAWPHGGHKPAFFALISVCVCTCSSAHVYFHTHAFMCT